MYARHDGRSISEGRLVSGIVDCAPECAEPHAAGFPRRNPYGDEPWTRVSSSSWVRTRTALLLPFVKLGESRAGSWAPSGLTCRGCSRRCASVRPGAAGERGLRGRAHRLWAASRADSARLSLRDHRAVLDTAAGRRTHQDRPARLRPAGRSFPSGRAQGHLGARPDARGDAQSLACARRRREHAPEGAPTAQGVPAAPGPALCRQDVLDQDAPTLDRGSAL